MAEDAPDETTQASAPTSSTLEEAIHSAAHDELLQAVADPALTEDLALALLKRADLRGEVIAELAKNRALLKHRKVKIVIATHPQAPRQVSVPLVRQSFTFDLMKVALAPTVPADVKRIAEETLLGRLKAVTLGERLSLARQASGRIAGALLQDGESRVMRAALENARLTEALVVQAVLKPEAGARLVQAASHHARWASRREVQIALLRTEHLSLARALVFGRMLPTSRLREILQASRLPQRIKDQLLREGLKADRPGPRSRTRS